MCFAPQRRAIFGHVNFKKWPESVVFSTFWLTNMLRATAACNFWTSERPKCLRRWGVFYILTRKYASRHSGLQFLNSGTSKMAPPLRCFLHFDLQICFAPQPRGILEHLNFQNGSANVVFSAFWLANVLRATAACHFSPAGQNSYIRTRRFSEATFRTSGTTTHWKNTAIRDVSNIWRACWTPCYWLYTHVSEPKLCFLWVPKVTWSILSACFLRGMGSNLAGVSVFSNLTLTGLWAAIVRNPRRSGVPEPDQSFVFQFFFIFLADYRFQRWREAFCQRVFCLAWARILLAFGCCGTGPKHCFLWARILLAFGCCGAGPIALFFMGSKSHVRHSFGVFFAWHGLDSCWRSVVSEPKLCFLWVPKVTWSILFACFLLGMGSNLAGVSVFSNLTLTRLWAAIVRNPRFERFFAWQRLAFGCFGTEALFFMGSKGDVKHSVCVFFAWHGLESCWCFGLFESDADETLSSVPACGYMCVSNGFLLGRGSTAAGVRVFRNRSFVFYGFQRWREAFCLRVFCVAWARILLVFRSFRIWRWRDFEQPSFGIHVSNGFLLGRGSTAAGVRVFRNRSFFFYGFQRWCEAFCLHVFCLAWAWILLVFRSFRIWRWRDFEQPSFGIHGVRVFLNRIKALFFILFLYF